MSRDRKQRRIRFIILACLALVPFLAYLEAEVLRLGSAGLPVSGNVLVFGLININVLLLLLMVFLVLRNLVHLVFERRKKLLGSRLRTKLVISFVSLSLIPTALLFFVALQFVSTSMDYWFNINVEQSLEESLAIGKTFYQEAHARVQRLGRLLGEGVTGLRADDLDALAPQLEKERRAHALDGLDFVSPERKTVISRSGPEFANQSFPELPANLLRRALEGEADLVVLQSVPAGDLVRGLTPVAMTFGGEARTWLLVVSVLVPRERLDQMELVSRGLQGYRQLMLLKSPIKTSILVMLLIVTLLIIFCAIWFGFYVARGLTGPMTKLAEATRRVAEGELDFVLEKDTADEMGTLVDSFNQMTKDLGASKKQLEQTNLALKQSNLELDQRRRYTEIVLQNVAAGVISVDESGTVTTVNRVACELLGADPEKVLHRTYRELLSPEHQAIFEDFLAGLEQSGKSSVQRPLRLTVKSEVLSLLVSLTRLEDDGGRPLGFVLVFDNLTQLEKAQRMAAWREVARRIAHEVKNPLTPIQLSAQRLRKKYLAGLGADGEVFDLCTRTIVSQVDELKRLVSEFSNFARMPEVRKAPGRLPEVVAEALVLFREAHKKVTFRVRGGDDLPVFDFDRKQMKQVLINLLDNAVTAVSGTGLVEVALGLDTERRAAIMEVRDDGPGVREEDKPRLFEPYFSTKKTGTGLGLAIATTIVADHGGYIRVKDRPGGGAVFTVELPLGG